jgi:hypothetical protein
MTTFMNNLNEDLFTELTPAESAVLEGGASFTDDNLAFDAYHQTKRFNVSSDATITLGSNIKGEAGTHFFATVYNPDTGKSAGTKTVYFGEEKTYWTNMKADDYIIQLTDEKDHKLAKGYVVVDY